MISLSQPASLAVTRLLLRSANAVRELERVPILMQSPGINVFGALAILAEIGGIARFANPKKLSSYAGLVPSLHRSGQTNTSGRITKAGRSRLRWVMVEAAHVAVRHDPRLGRFFQRLRAGKGTNVAVVATAHKMLVIIWHLLSGDGVYQGCQVQMIARRFLKWAWAVGEKYRCGSNKDFVSGRLQQIGIDNLTHIKRGGHVYSLVGGC
jgi:hypothetical protein